MSDKHTNYTLGQCIYCKEYTALVNGICAKCKIQKYPNILEDIIFNTNIDNKKEQ